MNSAVSDQAAIAFSIGFYQALGAGKTFEDGYRLGCAQIGLETADSGESEIPVLKIRQRPARDG
jgi:hypothetical protein